MDAASLQASLFADKTWMLEAHDPSSPPQALEVIANALSTAALAVAQDAQGGSVRTTSSIRHTKSVFEGRSAPPISLKDYLLRLWSYTKVSPVCFLVAYSYIDSLYARQHCQVSHLSAHRLILTATLLACKCYEDAVYDNVYFAKVGGISVRELNMLELEMLKLLDFRLLVDVHALSRHVAGLEAGCLVLSDEPLSEGSAPACFGS